MRSAASASVRRPRLTAPSKMPRRLARPRASASSSRSTRVTGRPASRRAAAMPAPMVPPPMTAAVRTGRGSTPLSAAGRGAARSAKKTWRRAAASGEARRSRKVSRSKAMAASKSASVARRRQASARRGAASPRAAFFTCLLGLLPEAGVGGERGAVAERRGERRQVGGEGDGAGAEVAVDDAVDQAELQRLRRLDRLAGGGELDGGGGRDEAGQADGAAGAGDDAEGDLGEADGGRGEGDAEAAGERDLEAAAEGGAVDGGGPGFLSPPRCGRRGRGGAAAPAACRTR